MVKIEIKKVFEDRNYPYGIHKAIYLGEVRNNDGDLESVLTIVIEKEGHHEERIIRVINPFSGQTTVFDETTAKLVLKALKLENEEEEKS
jgi:hypothetical protein